jgi:hypothetical protein
MMDNYDLLSITIENEFLKNAIRWPSQGLFQAIRRSVRRPLNTQPSSGSSNGLTLWFDQQVNALS